MRFMLAFAGLAAAALPARAQEQHPEGPTPPGARWAVHSWSRPRPAVVNPGPEAAPAPAPSDAIVLFDGHDLSPWMAEDSSNAKWAVRGGTSRSCLAPAPW